MLVNDAAMAALNRGFRGVDGPTDVLAFPMTEGPFGGLAPDLLGDVVISAETARRQAGADPGGLRAELALLVVHGILHLVGYDHGTPRDRRRMWRAQRAILRDCGLASPPTLRHPPARSTRG